MTNDRIRDVLLDSLSRTHLQGTDKKALSKCLGAEKVQVTAEQVENWSTSLKTHVKPHPLKVERNVSTLLFGIRAQFLMCTSLPTPQLCPQDLDTAPAAARTFLGCIQ